jgi:hypothetical protein
LRRCDHAVDGGAGLEAAASLQEEKLTTEAEPPSRRDDGGHSDLCELLARLSDGACPLERLSLAERFVRLATSVGISVDVRQHALRVVQDLSRRKPAERPCSRGLDVMKQRAKNSTEKTAAKRR